MLLIDYKCILFIFVGYGEKKGIELLDSLADSMHGMLKTMPGYTILTILVNCQWF